MTTIKATVKGKRLELDVPADWPDGIEVEIHPLPEAACDSAALSPEEIAGTLAAMDQIVPFVQSEVERSAWQAQRTARIEQEKARFAEHAEKLRSDWE